MLTDIMEQLASRRKLKKFDLDQGEMISKQKFVSTRLGLKGTLDLVIKSKEGIFPIEFSRTAEKPQKKHLYHLAADALLLEDHYGIIVTQGFIYCFSVPDIQVTEITDEKRKKTHLSTATTRLSGKLMPKSSLPITP